MGEGKSRNDAVIEKPPIIESRAEEEQLEERNERSFVVMRSNLFGVRVKARDPSAYACNSEN